MVANAILVVGALGTDGDGLDHGRSYLAFSASGTEYTRYTFTVIDRRATLQRLQRLVAATPVVALLGPRQVGKSTLARQLAAASGRATTFFDLENPADLRRLADPHFALERLRGLVVLDEVQRLPEVFPVLRVLADRPRSPARFLVLGSAGPALLKQTSETLAGRVSFMELSGFGLGEVGVGHLSRLWLRGGFPRSYTAPSHAAAATWRRNFVSTFVERDLALLGVATPAPTIRRFWLMLAHVHGQTLNWSELGRSMGVADTTVRRYVDVLEETFMVRQLPPWFANISKRQVKSPKIYLTDTGLLHTLLDIETQAQLEGHPKVGASFEGFVIAEIVRQLGARRDQCFYWATQAGAELDLLVDAGGRRRGFEIKLTSAPSVTPSMRAALTDLDLESLDVIHGGPDTYPLGPRVRAVSVRRLLEDVAVIGRERVAGAGRKRG